MENQKNPENLPSEEDQQNPIDFIEKKFKEYDELHLKFKAYHKATAEETNMPGPTDFLNPPTAPHPWLVVLLCRADFPVQDCLPQPVSWFVAFALL